MEKVVPRRYDEGWGLWHCKWYAVDDEIIFSGANLSDTYFTNRQDRYYHLRNQSMLFSYLSSLQRLYAGYSYRLHPNPPPSASPHHLIPLKPLPHNDSTLARSSRPALVWPEPSIHPRHFSPHALATISAFQRSWRLLRRSRRVDVDTWLFPMIQGGALGVAEEEAGVKRLLKCADQVQHGEVDLTSGYFGLCEPYKRAILNGNAPYRIVAASPEVSSRFLFFDTFCPVSSLMTGRTD